MAVVHRDRISATLPKDLSEWLKNYSKDTGIPQTVVLEKALKAYKENINK